ncbi:hypothetical protein FSY45_19280 [Comamonas sp. Z1]|uniref:hypothetical protein n=1 Tax=Comamonas sp. Z1 TaxID=2601246 RepID=UPI0011E6388B|nr:hypothetical protein [Comamonas sp. Z1]TYK74309.1 hypothetical protein FSY45_19280 [Comamonas sp. Z1]
MHTEVTNQIPESPPLQPALPIAWPKDAKDVRDFFHADFISAKFAAADQTPCNEDQYLISAHDFLSAVNWWANFPHAPRVDQAAPLPLLIRDIARDLGITALDACRALKDLGNYSVNMAVTAEMAAKLRELFPVPQAAPAAVAVPDGIAAFEKLLEASMAALTDRSSAKEHEQIWDDAHDALEAWKARAALAATPAAAAAPGQLGDHMQIRCRKCGDHAMVEFNSARIVTHNPHTGKPRDARDIASDPEGKLIVAPGPLVAAPAAAAPDMVTVTKEDANNYCRILTALGMEEEGDPIAEVQKLLAAAAAPVARTIPQPFGYVVTTPAGVDLFYRHPADLIIHNDHRAETVYTLPEVLAAAPEVLPEPDFWVRPGATIHPDRGWQCWSNDGTATGAFHADTVRALLAGVSAPASESRVSVPVHWMKELISLCGPEQHELRDRTLESLERVIQPDARDGVERGEVLLSATAASLSASPAAAVPQHQGMTIAGNGAAELGKLMREQWETRGGAYPDGNPNAGQP